jgi:hypothetical protein
MFGEGYTYALGNVNFCVCALTNVCTPQGIKNKCDEWKY